jgi:hypothetical protein
VVKRTSFPLHHQENLFGLIVSHLVLHFSTATTKFDNV